MGIARLIGSGVAGLGLVGAGYAGLAGQDETTRNESGEVVEAGEVGAFRIRLGDCLVEPPEGEFESAEAVPCSSPHTAEVFHAFNLRDEPSYPGLDAVSQRAEEECFGAFAGFVGDVPFEESVYGIGSMYPTVASWDAFDDREVLCLIGHYDGSEKTGSARGTNI